MKTVQTWMVVSVLFGASSAYAGWGDWLDKGAAILAEPETAATIGQLTNGEVTGGLKQALIVGSKKAIALLSQDGGYLNDQSVRIPLPDSLRTVETALRAVGQAGLADEFIGTMNHAAEKAVPQAVDIFSDTITSMTLDDARGILTGPDDSATQYFKRAGHDQLMTAILPIVRSTTEQAGMTSAYKSFIKQAEPYIQTGGQQAATLLKSFGGLGEYQGMADQAGQYLDTTAKFSAESMDLDTYVTEKALEGLFFKLAAEEKLIRTDPVARGTDLLQKVFGSVQ